MHYGYNTPPLPFHPPFAPACALLNVLLVCASVTHSHNGQPITITRLSRHTKNNCRVAFAAEKSSSQILPNDLHAVGEMMRYVRPEDATWRLCTTPKLSTVHITDDAP
jgi:hypothetical protein